MNLNFPLSFIYSFNSFDWAKGMGKSSTQFILILAKGMDKPSSNKRYFYIS